MQRESEAAAALKQALKLGLKDGALLFEVGAKYVEMGRAAHSLEPLRVAGTLDARCLLSQVQKRPCAPHVTPTRELLSAGNSGRDTAAVKTAISGPNCEPRSPNVKLIGCCRSVRPWSSLLGLRTVA